MTVKDLCSFLKVCAELQVLQTVHFVSFKLTAVLSISHLCPYHYAMVSSGFEHYFLEN